jgi:amylosucrase
MDWSRAERRHDPTTPEWRIYQGLLRLIALRKATPAFRDGQMDIVDTGNRHLLAYTRGGRVLVVANFSEQPQRAEGLADPFPVALPARDLMTGAALNTNRSLELAPYEVFWIAPTEQT